jgi:hypothetical protein
MVAVTDTSHDAVTAPTAVDGASATPARNIGVVPTASLLTGAAIGTAWFWIPLTILIIGISSIPSGIGFALSAVVFVYLMRGVEHVERVRSEAVFGLGIGVPPADIDQLIARTDTGAVVLSGAARRIEVHNVDGEVVTRDPIRVTESFSATTETSDIKVDFDETAPRTVDVSSQDGDVIIALPLRGPYVVNANAADGSTEVRVPQTTNRENAAAVVTARSDTGDVIIDDLR